VIASPLKIALAAALLLQACAAVPTALESHNGAVGPAVFRRVLAETPGTTLIVDVRSGGEHAEGAPRSSINIPIKSLAERLDSLPNDRPVVFYCDSGIRAHRAFNLAHARRPQLKVYWLDAYSTCSRDGSCVVEPRTH
jgi:rhodanese-related sulfurtransferase